MTREFSLYFRDEFRRARAEALADAEAFDEIIIVLERLGAELQGPRNGLAKYEEKITKLARASPMAFEIPGKWHALHPSFTDLYNAVRIRRNEAIHAGAVARHLTQHAVILSLILEEAIMSDPGFRYVRDFMVTGPVCAELWQPLSFLRQKMLQNSFSYLPLKIVANDQEQWRLVSDRALAKYLREPAGAHRARLAQKLSEALAPGKLQLEKPQTAKGEDEIATVIKHLDGLPILVTDGTTSNLVGILTAYDLL